MFDNTPASSVLFNPHVFGNLDSFNEAAKKALLDQGTARALFENAKRLSAHAQAVENYLLNISHRPDLLHPRPEQPLAVKVIGQDQKTWAVEYVEGPEVLGSPAPVQPPPIQTPAPGKISIGVKLSRGYQALPDDTVEDGQKITHPQTGEKLVKKATPFGGVYLFDNTISL